MTGVDRYALEISMPWTTHWRATSSDRGLTLRILSPAGAVNASPFVNIPVRLLPSAPGPSLGAVHATALFEWWWTVQSVQQRSDTVTKQIVCIHDANTRLVPESYGLAFRTIYRLIQPSLGSGLRGS